MKKEKLQKETKEERTVIKDRKKTEKRVSQEAREGQVSVGLNASKVTKGQKQGERQESVRSAMRKRGEFGKTVFCRVMTKAQQAWMPRTALGSRGEKETLESPTVLNEISCRMEAEAELPRRVYGVNGVVGVASRGFLPKGGGA